MTKNQIYELFPIGPEIPDPRRLFDPLTAVMGGVGMVGNVVGGIMGKSAAHKAGQIQQQAANAAADQITKTTADVNPSIAAAAQAAGDRTVSAAGTAADQANLMAHSASAGVNAATDQANVILDPYSQAGQTAAGVLNAGVAQGGQFSKTPTMADIEIDPGYAFRLQQGQQQLDRSAAARGGAVSGAALKDLTNYSQGAASQEYANAFSRFQQNRENVFGNTLAVSDQGQRAGIQQGNNLTGAARYAGDTGLAASEFGGQLNTNANQFAGTENSNAANLMASNTINAASKAGDYRTGGAAAQAAGIVGGTNALTSGIGGAINTGMNAVALNNLLKNPAVPGGIVRSTPR
jgi:hypothetical protein